MKHTRRVIAWILAVAMLITNVDYVRAANASNQTSTNIIQDILDDVSAELVTDGDADDVDVSENEAEVSENDVGVSENEVPGEDVSEGEVSEGDVSEGDVSEGDVSEGDVSEVNNASIKSLSYSGEVYGITWEIDSDGVLTISGEQETGKFIPAQDNWLKYSSSIKEVVVTAKNVDSTRGWFYECKNVQKFDFSNFDTSNVTNMAFMFERCSGLKTIDVSDLDTSKVTTMYAMFKDCNNLLHANLSTFDTSNVTEMGFMFDNCEKLRSVNLSSFDTSKVTSMTYMFGDCMSLMSLDLSNFDMSNVTQATDMFYYCISIIRINTFRNAKINISLPHSPMVNGGKEVYNYFPKNLSESICLYYYGEPKDTGNTDDTGSSGFGVNLIVCDKRSQNPIPGVSVTINSTNYTTNAEGAVSFSTNKNIHRNASFSHDEYKSLLKDMTLYPGDNYVYLERDIQIQVPQPEIKAEVPLKSSFEFDGESVTWLNMKLNLNLEDSVGRVPVSYKYNADDDTYLIIFGTKDSVSTDEEENPYETIRDLCNNFDGKTAGSNLKNYMKKNCTPNPGSFGVSADFSLMGYFKYDANTNTLLENGVVLAVKAEGCLTWRPAIGGGIIYVKAKLGIGTEGKLVAIIEDERVNYTATLNFDQTVGIAAGAGCDLLHGEIGADITFHEQIDLPFKKPKDDLKVRFSGMVYMEAVAFVFEARKEFEVFNVGLYPELDLEGVNATNSISNVDTSTMLLSRDYQPMLSTPQAKEYLLENVYGHSDTQMVMLDNGTVISVWLADTGEKTSVNRTTLVYSVDGGFGWSEAKPVFETGRADFYPHLAVDGEKAALTFVSMDTVLPENASVEDFAKHADLYVSVFENGVFSEPELISDAGNQIAEMSAEIAIDGDKLAVVWVENSTNDPYFGEGVNTIYLSTYNGNKWTKETVASNVNYINSIAVGFLNSVPNVAYTVDEDNDQNTSTDVEMYLWTSKRVTRVTSDQKLDGSAQFLGDKLYWASDGEVMQMQVGNMDSIVSTGVMDTQDMVVLENATNKAILFVGADGFKSELFLSEESDGIFGKAVPVTDNGNKISNFAAVYKDNGDVTTMYFEREVLYGEEEEVAENEATRVASVQVQTTQTASSIFGATNMHVCQDLAAHNVILRDAWYSMWDLTDDNKLPISLELYNASSEPLTSVTVSLNADGQAFYTETVTCDIEANGVADVTIHYPLNAAQMGRDVVVKAVPGNFTDSNLSDNVYDMTLGYADIVLKDFAVEKVEGQSIITGTVVNEGYQAAGDVSFKVLEGGQNGAEIYSISCGDMAVGAEYPVSYTIPAEKLNFESAFETKYFYVVTDTEDGEEAYGNNSQVMPVFPVRVTGVTLDAEELTMTAGTTAKLTATVAPADAINKNVYFASSSHEVAVVLEDGTIIACAEGTAIITVLTGDGHFTKSCVVTVTAPAEGAPDYTMNTRWASIEKGSTLQLSVLDAQEQAVSGIHWSSSDENVAAVDENGLVTGKEVGATYILCSNAEGTYNNVAVIHVTSKELQALVFEESSVDMTEGETYEQQPIYCPEDTTTDMALTWTSSDETVATVDAEGVVTAVAGGRATITATAVNGISASYDVKVTALPRYTVTFDSGMGDEPVEIEGILGGSTVTLPAAPVRENYSFVGWFTEENGQGEKFTADTVVNEDLYLYACWAYEDQTPEGLWATEVAPQTYTGKAIKPVVQVHDGHTLLNEKTDYTISYKNNVKANDASDAKKAPTITIKGKGNYTGTETITFQILKKDLAAEDVTVTEMVAAANDKVQKPVPVLTYNGKKLKNKTDFTVTYPDLDNKDLTDAYKKAGTYTIHVEGKGNFEGSRDITFTITDAVLMSKAKIAKIDAQPYTGSAIEPEVKVTYKNQTLVKGTDYTVAYKNNVDVGKATVIVTGMGDYAGTKEATFAITGISIAKAKVNGVTDKVYNGAEQTQDSFEVMLGETKLDPSDYTVSYQKNENVGKATMVITGQGNYTGTVKKTFKITARDITSDATCMWASQMEYTKGGTKNYVSVIADGVTLTEKKDYTITYSNNKKVTKEGDKKLPTFTIKGKGNYKGQIQKTYTIVPKDLTLAGEPVSITAPDVPYNKKPGKYMSKPVLTDVNGKKLAAGTDYEKTFTYTLEDGTVLDPKKDAPSAGTLITVTVNGKGGYTGTATATYRIGEKAFKSAKIKVDAQVYTGSEISLEPSDIKVTMGKETLTYGEDYVIVEDSYKNNVKKGTASVTIKGVGDYAGEKTVKFKIASKKFIWFWNLF